MPIKTVLVLFLFFITTRAAWAVDYDKIDRLIVAEPAYQSVAPKYGLLVFGPEARTRVWVVLDGDSVFIDMNSDGNLTGESERFASMEDCKGVKIEAGEKNYYVITGVSAINPDSENPLRLQVDVDVVGPIAYKQYCDIQLRNNIRHAAIAHFGGPLSIGPDWLLKKQPEQFKRVSRNWTGQFFATIGTFDIEFGCWVVVRTHNGADPAFTEDMFPVVDVTFPHKERGKSGIPMKFMLDGFC